MKKYIKPAIEVLNIGATMPLMASEIYVDQSGTVIDPETGGDGGSGMWAPGKKGSADDWEDEEDTGLGW